MAAPLMTPGSDLVRDFPAQTVYVRATHAAAWEAIDYLYCERLTECLSPQVPTAELVWDYGKIRQAGKEAEAACQRQDFKDYQVRIKIADGDDFKYWHGVILDTGDARGGALTEGDDRLLIGQQRFMAYGFEAVFDRVFVDSSFVKNNYTGSIYQVRRGLEFNAENKHNNQGNRSVTAGPWGCHVFADSLASGDSTWWSSWDIAKYLVSYFSPRDQFGVSWIPFQLGAICAITVPDWDHPVIPCDGRTLREVFNQLFDRRRNLAWKLTFNHLGTPPESIALEVFPFNADAIVMPGGGTQNGNPYTMTLDFDRARDVHATLSDSGLHKVEQVIVRGGRKRTCASFAYADGTLEADWAAADETDYEAGPAGIAGFDIDEQERKVKTYRESDQFERVFSWFRVPPTFDGQVGDGSGGAKVAWFPDDDYYGAEKVYLPELRFERHLPKGLSTEAPTDSPDFEPSPFAIIETEENYEGNRPWEFCDRLAATAQIEGIEDEEDADGAWGGAGRKWSASLRMQEDCLGVVLKVHGAAQHVIAADNFAQTFDWDDPAILTWHELIVTAMVSLDTRVEVRYPEPAAAYRLGHDVTRRVTIDVGDKARLDYVTAKTVIDVGDGEPLVPGAAYYARDDRPAMRDLARFAYQWYVIERHAFTLSIDQLTGILPVGYILTSIGGDNTEQAVNAMVTSVTWDVATGQTAVQTSFAELDFRDFYAG